MSQTIHLRTEVEIPVEPSEIVDAVGANDEKLFMLIWNMLDDDRIGVETKQRLWRALEDDLTDSGNHPDYEDEKIADALAAIRTP